MRLPLSPLTLACARSHRATRYAMRLRKPVTFRPYGRPAVTFLPLTHRPIAAACVAASIIISGLAILALLAFAVGALPSSMPDRYHYHEALADGHYCYAMLGKLCPTEKLYRR